MRCVRDTASVCMSCTTGLHVVSSLRRSVRRIRLMRSRSMTMWIDACGNGSQTQAIFTRHPKRQLHEVHYARCVTALEDKVVQRATVAMLNAIWAALRSRIDHPRNHGFAASAVKRPNDANSQLIMPQTTISVPVPIAPLTKPPRLFRARRNRYLISAGPRHPWVWGSRTRPLPQPPIRSLVGTEVLGDGEATPTVAALGNAGLV